MARIRQSGKTTTAGRINRNNQSTSRTKGRVAQQVGILESPMQIKYRREKLKQELESFNKNLTLRNYKTKYWKLSPIARTYIKPPSEIK